MKRILIFSTILVLVVSAGAIIYFRWRSDFVKNQLPQLVFLKSDSVYTISYSSVVIDEINGEIKIEDLKLTPDTTHKKEADSLPRVLLEVSTPLLHLSGLHTDEAMMNEEVIARKLLLNDPVVTLYNNHGSRKKKGEDVFTTKDIYKAILRNLVRIKIDSILIDDARYSMVHWRTRDTILSGSPVNISLFHLDISDSTSTDPSRVLFATKAVVNVGDLFINNQNKIYNYRISKIELDSEKKSLTAKSISVRPLLGETAFMRTDGRETDRYDVDVSGASFGNIDVEQALDGNIVADNLEIRKGVIKIYRDKNYPPRNVSKVGRYPHQQLMRLPVDVSIQKLDIRNGYIEYKEKSDVTGNTGKMSFHQVALSITNFTNRRADLRQDAVMHVHMNARFLDAVAFNVRLLLYPNDKKGKFTADGKLGPADATVFNQLIVPLGMATIESGRLNSLEFHFQGNDYGANGKLTVLYNDFKVKLLQKDAEDGRIKSKKLASFLANVALKNDNPKKNKPPRVAHVTYKRDVYKSFFNLIWKTIFTGVRETVGIETEGVKTDTR
jgi:hypothetical protein